MLVVLTGLVRLRRFDVSVLCINRCGIDILTLTSIYACCDKFQSKVIEKDELWAIVVMSEVKRKGKAQETSKYKIETLPELNIRM